jgi:hypothetical protein
MDPAIPARAQRRLSKFSINFILIKNTVLFNKRHPAEKSSLCWLDHDELFDDRRLWVLAVVDT